MTESNDQRGAFIHFLLSVAQRQDRGVLADLRADLSGHSSGRVRSCRHVVPYLAEWEQPDDQWYYVVGGLFAFHPLHTNEKDNFGASLRKLRKETQSDSLDKHFLALLDADAEDAPKHLRSLVGQLASKPIPVNWYQLLNDLCFWSASTREVQKRWARSYYRANAPQTNETEESEQTDED